MNLTEEYLAKYPIDNKSEVIESKKSADELFSSTRSYLITTYKDAVTGARAVMDKSMISLPLTKRFNADIGLGSYIVSDMYLTLLVEFKEGKMRVQTIDVSATPSHLGNSGRLTAINYGTVSTTTGLRGSASNDEAVRKATSEHYQAEWEKISEAMHKIADGTMEGLDW